MRLGLFFFNNYAIKLSINFSYLFLSPIVYEISQCLQFKITFLALYVSRNAHISHVQVCNNTFQFPLKKVYSCLFGTITQILLHRDERDTLYIKQIAEGFSLIASLIFLEYLILKKGYMNVDL